MEARIINDRHQWDDFVAQSVCCNVTQSYEWSMLAPHIGAEPLRVGVVDDTGKLCAAILILISRAPIINRTYFYAARGPVIDDPNSPAMTVLLNFLKAEARRRNAFMLKVEPSVPDGDAQWLSALHKHGFHPTPYFTHPRHEWVLDIQPDEKDLLKGMKEKWRYNIRLAGRKGVTVRRGGSQEDIDAFYKIYQVTSERDHFFIHEKEHYEDAMRYFSEDDRIALFMAECEGKTIGAAMIVCLGKWSWYLYGASSNEYRDRMPNHLVQWTSIQWAKSKGCWYYNFRGIPNVLEEGEELWGVYLFKRGFGGYPLRFLETHDLVYQPLVYQTYKRLLSVKRWRDERQRQKMLAAEEATRKSASSEQTPVNS